MYHDHDERLEEGDGYRQRCRSERKLSDLMARVAYAGQRIAGRSVPNSGDENMHKQWIVSNPKVMMG